jgi:hypothetical protein
LKASRAARLFFVVKRGRQAWKRSTLSWASAGDSSISLAIASASKPRRRSTSSSASLTKAGRLSSASRASKAGGSGVS